MTDTPLDEVKRRIATALWLEEVPDDWLERAEDACLAQTALSASKKMPPPVDLETFGGRVRWAREVTGMSIREVARRIGLSPWRMNDVEKGREDFPAEKLPGLSMSLGVKRAWLLGESDEGGPPYPTGVLRSLKSEAYYRYWAKRRAGAKRWKAQREHERQKELKARAKLERAIGAHRGASDGANTTTDDDP